MIYQPRTDDCWKQDMACNEQIAAWIEDNFSGKWIRFYNEPVKLVYLSVPHVEHPINTIRLKQGAKVEIERWRGERRMVGADFLQALHEGDFLVCPVCEGDGEVTPLNNPTGQRCPDCFGTGRFLHELK